MILLPEVEASLWGVKQKVRHCYIQEVQGDGELLMAIEMMDHRPAFYVMWVDSSIKNLDQDDFFEFAERPCMNLIIEECGWDDDSDEDEKIVYEWPVFPALNGSGCWQSWLISDKSRKIYEQCKKYKNNPELLEQEK